MVSYILCIFDVLSLVGNTFLTFYLRGFALIQYLLLGKSCVAILLDKEGAG